MIRVQLLFIFALTVLSIRSQLTCPDFDVFSHRHKLVKELHGTYHTLYSGVLTVECHSPTWYREDHAIFSYVKEANDCCVRLDITEETNDYLVYTSDPMNGCAGPVGYGDMKIIAEIRTHKTGSCLLVYVCADTKYGYLVQCRKKAERTQKLLDELNRKFQRALGPASLPTLITVPSDDCASNTNCP